MIDAVLSAHADPLTCGVKKWNDRLAQELGVPSDRLVLVGSAYRHPLLSLKLSELPPNPDVLAELRKYPQPYSVLWHGPADDLVSQRAAHVLHAEEIGCPSTIRGNATRKGLTVLSYGMAHKAQLVHFERLKHLLEAKGDPYTVCISSAVHEGNPWDSLAAPHTALLEIFGEHLRFLGFLADDALAREIRDCHMAALFYEGGVRANNTTLWAALEVGTPVITNLDRLSPKVLEHNASVFDIAQLTEWPCPNQLREVRFGGYRASQMYSWPNVVDRLRAVYA